MRFYTDDYTERLNKIYFTYVKWYTFFMFLCVFWAKAKETNEKTRIYYLFGMNHHTKSYECQDLESDTGHGYSRAVVCAMYIVYAELYMYDICHCYHF